MFLAFSGSRKEARKARKGAGALLKSARKERREDGRERVERLKSSSKWDSR